MKTVSLDQFLIKATPVDMITDTGDKMTVYIRSLKQIERDLCQAGARRVARDLRKLLEDNTTEEFQLLIADEIDEYDEALLRQAWVNSRVVKRALDINRKSLEDRDQTFVPEPDEDADEAAWERYENEVDAVEQQREQFVQSAIKTAQEQLEAEAAEIPGEDLRGEVIPGLIDNICQQAWTQEYAIQMVARGTFTDEACTQPVFKTTQEVRQLKVTALEHLVNSHYGLLVEPEAIKNSQGGRRPSTSSRPQTSPTNPSSRNTKARPTGRGKSRSRSRKPVES